MGANDPDQPILTPEPAIPGYLSEPDRNMPLSPLHTAGRFVLDLVRIPVHWWRANVVEPNKGPKYYWYHRKYPRALPIDECYLDDLACMYEATLEYKRNYLVDKMTVDLLRERRDTCWFWKSTSNAGYRHEDCTELGDVYERELLNFFIKYGDLKHSASAMDAYMKQKNRMIVERRKAIRDAKKAEER